MAGPLLLAGGTGGVATFRLAPDGTLAPTASAPLALHGSVAWLCAHPSGTAVFVTLNPPRNEPLPDTPQTPVTDVVALALEPTTGALRLLNRQPCGRTPCHCVCDATGRWLLASSFLGGSVVVYPICPDGSLGEATQHQSQLAAINEPEDDEATLSAGGSRSSAHQVALSPQNDLALVSDLRLDSVLAYRFDSESGRLAPAGRYESELHIGCRHLVFDGSGRFAYGINQGRLSHPAGSLSVYAVNTSNGSADPLREIARLPTLPVILRKLLIFPLKM